MEWLLLLLVPLLGCALMMAACAAMMWGGHRLMVRRSRDATELSDHAEDADKVVSSHG
jgi:hypothetical protein